MNAETFEIIDRTVQRMNLDFAAVAGTGIDFANVRGAAEDRLNSRPKPLAETFDRFVPCRSVRRTAEQTLVSAVGVNAIFRGELQFLAMASGEFALIRHADSRIHIR